MVTSIPDGHFHDQMVTSTAGSSLLKNRACNQPATSLPPILLLLLLPLLLLVLLLLLALLLLLLVHLSIATAVAAIVVGIPRRWLLSVRVHAAALLLAIAATTAIAAITVAVCLGLLQLGLPCCR